MSKKNSSKKKRRINFGKIFLVFLMFVIALGLMLYPFISNYLFENRADGIIETVEATAENANKEEFEAELAVAREYNDKLASGHVQLKDPFNEDIIKESTEEYTSVLNMTEDGVMGFIEIPSIDVSLPIYHGTSEEILEIGAGHLQETSLPVGGPSTHSVITGHTGLSSAKLFTDLVKLEEGDLFFLYIMGENMAYEVDQINVVLPHELEKLNIKKGEDLCTLVTCTPYGVNTHRLLVRGHRTDYKEAAESPKSEVKKQKESKWMEEYLKSIIISSVAFIVCMIILLICRYISSLKEKKEKRKRRLKREKMRRKQKQQLQTEHSPTPPPTHPKPKTKTKKIKKKKESEKDFFDDM